MFYYWVSEVRVNGGSVMLKLDEYGLLCWYLLMGG